ncbi:MAG: hypothetical protein VXA66_07825, partial [Alphaproteobacteria bacterium]
MIKTSRFQRNIIIEMQNKTDILVKHRMRIVALQYLARLRTVEARYIYSPGKFLDQWLKIMSTVCNKNLARLTFQPGHALKQIPDLVWTIFGRTDDGNLCRV